MKSLNTQSNLSKSDIGIFFKALTVIVSNSGATQRVEPAAAAAPVTARPPPQQNFVSDPTRYRADG